MSVFEDVRDPNGKLLFRIDHDRALIEIQRRGQKTIIDLQASQVKGKAKECTGNADAG